MIYKVLLLILIPLFSFGQVGKKITSNSLKHLDSSLASAFLKAQKQWKLDHPTWPQVVAFCTYRSPAQQAYLYAQGRTRKGTIITQLKSGGAHNKYPAMAMDIAFIDKKGRYQWQDSWTRLFSPYLELYGFDWGGRWAWKDWQHFEVKKWRLKRKKK